MLSLHGICFSASHGKAEPSALIVALFSAAVQCSLDSPRILKGAPILTTGVFEFITPSNTDFKLINSFSFKSKSFLKILPLPWGTKRRKLILLTPNSFESAIISGTYS